MGEDLIRFRPRMERPRLRVFHLLGAAATRNHSVQFLVVVFNRRAPANPCALLFRVAQESAF